MLKVVTGPMSFLAVAPKACPQLSSLPTIKNSATDKESLPTATPEMVEQCCRAYPVAVAVPDEHGDWVNIPVTAASPQQTSNLIEGERFQEEIDGVRRKKDGIQITNARLRIKKIIEKWYSESRCREIYVLAISCPEAFGDAEHDVSVPKEHFRNAYQIIRSEFPGVFAMLADSDSQAEYLTKIHQRDADVARREVHVMCSGWHTIRGQTRFYVGEDEEYATEEQKYYASCIRPAIRAEELMAIFSAGAAFLEIGHYNVAIVILFLKAHEGADGYWLRNGGIQPQSTLFLLGPTGSLKTSTASVIAAVHHLDRSFATIRITSSRASIRNRLIKMRDQVLVVDDYSNSEPKTRAAALENMEDVLRAIGDGVLPEKASGKDYSQNTHRSVRSTVILTGEEEPSLGRSSWNRLTTLNVGANTFDGTVLARFQNTPMLLNHYFTAFEDFLTQYGSNISAMCSGRLEMYREEYGKMLSTRRFVDAAAELRLQADIICQYSAYCGMPSEWTQQFLRLAEDSIRAVFQENQRTSVAKDPIRRFLEALMQSIGTTRSNGLADDEVTYIKSISDFVGFCEKERGLLWIRVADAMDMVRCYYRKLGQEWLPEEMTIKKMLLEQGFSEGEKGSRFLRRAKKGPRQRMLVLHEAKVEKILNQEGIS